MNPSYEIVQYKHGLNARILIHGVREYKLHWHREIEILLVLKGRVLVTVGGQKHELKEDDILFINSGDMHSTLQGYDNIIIAIQINPQFCENIYPEFEKMVFHWPVETKDETSIRLFQQMRLFIARMVEEYRQAQPGMELAIEGLLNAMMYFIVRQVPSTKLPVPDESEKGDPYLRQRIQRISDYIHEHYAEKISLESLAQEVYLNPYYLSHFFKKKMGFTFQEYLDFVRLQKATELVSQTDKQISVIAQVCGFPGTKSFNRVFKNYYGFSPRVMRSQQDATIPLQDQVSYLGYDSLHVMAKLREYLDIEVETVVEFSPPMEEEIAVDLAGPARVFCPRGKRLASVARAFDILREDLRAQIREAARELGMKHLRFHGIFSDELHVVRRDAEGGFIYTWNYIDSIFDFLIGLGVRPLADLTFMPAALKSGDKAVFWYQGNVSQPQSLNDWGELVYHFAAHCIDRYGAEEVRQWYFEIWNEPNMSGFWDGAPEDYFRFFKASVEALIRADPCLKIAGPALCPVTNLSIPLVDDFIAYLNAHKLPLHCFTFHVYDEIQIVPYQDIVGGMIGKFGSSDRFSECVEYYRQKAETLEHAPEELFITEYNISGIHENYLLDTLFPACHLLYNLCRNHDRIQGVAVWTLSDIFEEDGPLARPFSGGFGIITLEGIRKPAYWALWFIHRLERDIIAQGDEYIVTRGTDRITILGFRYRHYDRFFQEGDRSLLRYNSRYEVFEGKSPLSLGFSIRNIRGTWMVREYTLDRSHGSAYDLYVDMGMPLRLSATDADYLRESARPHLSVRTLNAGEGGQPVELRLTVQPLGIKFLELQRVRE
ncbi:MAG: helix-turn-helix domain-containing protein [Treponema sp.]|jgi:xylan 1,4-beta-xylosidase|nr:helix-turn-helix domain-containing protein [Treponema sp.]